MNEEDHLLRARSSSSGTGDVQWRWRRFEVDGEVVVMGIPPLQRRGRLGLSLGVVVVQRT
jgi:hypothetical protein